MSDFDEDYLRYRDNTLHRGEIAPNKEKMSKDKDGNLNHSNYNNYNNSHSQNNNQNNGNSSSNKHSSLVPLGLLSRSSSTKDAKQNPGFLKPSSFELIPRRKRNTLENVELPKTGFSEFVRHHKGPIMCMLVDKETIYTGGWDRLIKSYDTERERITHTFIGHDGWVSALLRNGFFLYSGSSDGDIIMWDARTGSKMKTFIGHTAHIQKLKNHPYGEGDIPHLFSCSTDSTVRIWSFEVGTCVRLITGSESIRDITFFQKFIISSSQFSIHIWNGVETEKTEKKGLKTPAFQVLKGHEDTVWGLLVHKSNLYSSSWDKTVKCWDLETFEEKVSFRGHTEPVFTMAIEDDTLYTGSGDCTARSWKLDGTNTFLFRGHEGSIEHLTIKDNKLFTASADHTIRSWNRHNGETIHVYKGHKGYVTEIMVVDSIVFSRSFDGSIGVWGSGSKKEYSTQVVHKRVYSAGRILNKTDQFKRIDLERSNTSPVRNRRSSSQSTSGLISIAETTPTNLRQSTSPIRTASQTMISPAPPGLPSYNSPGSSSGLNKVFSVQSSPVVSTIIVETTEEPDISPSSRRIIKSRSHQHVPQYFGNTLSQTSTVDSLNLEVLSDLPVMEEPVGVSRRNILSRIKNKVKSPRKDGDSLRSSSDSFQNPDSVE